MPLSFRKAVAASVAALLGSAGLVAAEAAPAAAAPSKCEVVNTYYVPHIVSYFNEENRTTSLQWRISVGRQVAYAYLGGSTQPGDRVWFDVSSTSGRTWEQCGPFTVTRASAGKISAGSPTSSNPAVRMRACSRLAGDWHTSRCTPWW